MSPGTAVNKLENGASIKLSLRLSSSPSLLSFKFSDSPKSSETDVVLFSVGESSLFFFLGSSFNFSDDSVRSFIPFKASSS